MNAEAIMCLQAIANALIETEAMKAENMARQAVGDQMQYHADSFFIVADNMNNRVRDLVQWVR